MRISDWSSDVCSSDLRLAALRHLPRALEVYDRQDARHDRRLDAGGPRPVDEAQVVVGIEEELGDRAAGAGVALALQVVEVGGGVARSDARSVGKECVSQCRSRW